MLRDGEVPPAQSSLGVSAAKGGDLEWMWSARRTPRIGFGAPRRRPRRLGFRAAGRALLALLTFGCTGGQTGEITELTQCEHVAEMVPTLELEAELRTALEASTTPRTYPLAWTSGGDSTSLSLTVTPTADPVARLGIPGCASAWRAFVHVDLATADARLDATLEGELRFDVDGLIRLAAEGPTADGAVLLVAEPAGERWVGTLTRNGTETLATF